MKKIYKHTILGVGIILPLSAVSGLIINNEINELQNESDVYSEKHTKSNISIPQESEPKLPSVSDEMHVTANKYNTSSKDVRVKIFSNPTANNDLNQTVGNFDFSFDFSNLQHQIIGNDELSKKWYNNIKFKLNFDFPEFLWFWGNDDDWNHYESLEYWKMDDTDNGTNPMVFDSKNSFFGRISSMVNDFNKSVSQYQFLIKNTLTKPLVSGLGSVSPDTDYSKINLNFNKSVINGEKTVMFTLKYILSAKETGDGSGWWTAHSALGYIEHSRNPLGTLTTTLPYSENDLINLTNTFKNYFLETFVLDSPSLVGFPSNNFNTDSKENEKAIFNEANARINNFKIDDTYDNSPLGNLPEATTVEAYRISDQIDQTGDLKIGIRLKLNDRNAKFIFEKGKAPANSYETIMKIKIYPMLNHDYEIDQLIKITPYEISGQGYKDFSKVWTKKTNISDNYPLDNELNPFVFNINAKNQNGETNLIPVEKMPLVSKYGSTIKVNFKLTIQTNEGPHTVQIPVSFKRVFGNGEMVINQQVAPIKLPENDFATELSFEKNILPLSMQIIGNNIFVKNNKKINIAFEEKTNSSKKVPKVTLSIESAEASIPQDQNPSPSNWKTIVPKKPLDDAGFINAGEYQTEDPFIFEFTNTNIPTQGRKGGEYSSRYVPYINGKPLTLSVENIGGEYSPGKFVKDLGEFVLGEKQENGKVKVNIEIKEFDPSSTDPDPYKILRYAFTVDVDLINSSASYMLAGWESKEIITDKDKEKYFNKEGEDYRGEFVDEKTGMYIPKIAWVNSMPPEGFLFDPRDEEGNLITKPDSGGENTNYDVGYIAQLNATGFIDNDFPSSPLIGGYTTEFSETEYKPTGSYPYNSYYQFKPNSNIPVIQKIPLSQSGLLTNNENLRQIVLKRQNNHSFLYQFSLISREIKKNIFELYKDFVGSNNKPLFIDFWDTHHGKNLVSFLMSKGIISGNEEVKSWEYSDVIQYWSMYVNNPENYNNTDEPNNNALDISKIKLAKQFSKIKPTESEFKKQVSSNINQELNRVVKEKKPLNGHILTLGEDYRIEENDLIFQEKLNDLRNNYEKPLSEAKSVCFNIIAIVPDIKNPNYDVLKWYIKGKTTIEYLNNKYIEDIVDLSTFKGSTFKFNSELPDFLHKDWSKEKIIKELIYSDIHEEINRFYKNNGTLNNKLTLNKDYTLSFYSKSYNELTGNFDKFYFTTIEKAIANNLLFQSNNFEFDNTLYVDVSAAPGASTIKNEYLTVFNNGSTNEIHESITPIDLSKIEVNNININSQHTEFPTDKIETIKNLIYSRIQKDIDFYTRFLYLQTNYKPSLGRDYTLQFINQQDPDNDIFYETIDEAISSCLLLDTTTNPTFNNTLIVRVVANKESDYLYNSFDKKINNSYLNEAIEEDPGVPGITNPDTVIPPIIDDNLTPDFEIPVAVDNNLWWIITPIVIASTILVVSVSIIVIRKNRQVR